MTDKQRDEYLAQEYLALYGVVEDYDGRALTIKAWSVTFGAAGLGLAYGQHEPLLLLLAAASAIVFWITEAIWKMSQHAHIRRLVTIEVHFEGKVQTTPFKIMVSWRQALAMLGGYRRVDRFLIRPRIALPHVIVLVAGVSLFLLFAPQGEKPQAPEPGVIYVAR